MINYSLKWSVRSREMWVCNFVRYHQVSLKFLLLGNEWESAYISIPTSSKHVASLITLKLVSDSIFSTHVSYWELVWTYLHVQNLSYFFFDNFTIYIIFPFLCWALGAPYVLTKSVMWAAVCPFCIVFFPAL